MDVHTNIPLKNYTTMKLGGNARFIVEIHNASEVAEVYKRAQAQNLSVFVLGGGSNVIVRDEGYDGIVALMRIPGFEIVNDDLNSTTIKLGAGEAWDGVVRRVVEMNLSGIEAMSGIPGTAGAAPVQNVGAYGQEIADVLVELEAYDSQNGEFITLQNADCGFSYRHSIFRGESKGRYVIGSITIKLSKNSPQPPFYDSLQKYFDERKMTIFTAASVRQAVIDIRSSKLPDPDKLPSSGSFFKNAIVEEWQLEDIKSVASDVPVYDMGDGKYKIPTGWLIENVGLKGKLINGMRVYDKNAVVLVNESAGSYLNLAAARDKIVGAVRDTFHIQIEQEPLEMI